MNEQNAMRVRLGKAQQKTLIFCWELGLGNGHIGPFQPIAKHLSSIGWRVVVIARDLSKIPTFFAPGEIEVYQAPFKISRAHPHVPYPRNFAEMLQNLGYRDSEELTAMVSAWRALFDHIGPSFVLADHSPTALLAARGTCVPVATIGHGFYLPKFSTPTGPLSVDVEVPQTELVRLEEEVVASCNQALAVIEAPPLGTFIDLYKDAKQHFLATYSELDHNGPREGDYRGALQSCPRSNSVHEISWPAQPGPRVFAYLKSMPGLSSILNLIVQHRSSAIVVLDQVDPGTLADFKGGDVRILNKPIPIGQIKGDVDLAITNAGHGTICELLLAGVSQMMIPLTLEQALLSAKVKAIGAGLDARRDQPEAALGYLDYLLRDPHQLGGARAFQKRHQHLDAKARAEGIVNSIVELTGGQ